MTSRILPVIAGFSLALTPMLIPASAQLGQVDLADAPARLSLQVAGDPAGANCRPIVIAEHVPLIPVAMHLTFHDDFDEHPLSNGRWTPHYAGGAAWPEARYWGGDGSDFKRKTSDNGEQQIYVDPRYAGRGTTPLGLDPFKVHDGVLSIVATRTPPAAETGAVRQRIHIGHPDHAEFVCAETRLFRNPRPRSRSAPAVWPAFWLLANDGGWPPEIDIVEGRGQEPGEVVMTTHWRIPTPRRSNPAG